MSWIAREKPSGTTVGEVAGWLMHHLPFGSPQAVIESVDGETGAYHIIDEVPTNERPVRLTWVASKTGDRVRLKRVRFAPPGITPSS